MTPTPIFTRKKKYFVYPLLFMLTEADYCSFHYLTLFKLCCSSNSKRDYVIAPLLKRFASIDYFSSKLGFEWFSKSSQVTTHVIFSSYMACLHHEFIDEFRRPGSKTNHKLMIHTNQFAVL